MENCAYLRKNPGYAPVVPFSKLLMRVRKFTKACERKLHIQLYIIISRCNNTDVTFKISIKTIHIARKVVRLPPC